ncbi:MAG: trigger factor [Tannerella sp.]|jgi:trigger factor|nr:trigger factor [Tannerella sp.]
MNISLVNNDTVSGIVKMVVEKKDYEAQVEKQLRQYRQKADIPGFRKGMAPLGMIRKMYGKYLLTEEVNKCISENLLKYIRTNGIGILGEPLPNETEQQPIDFDTQEDFEFYFDIALSPQIDIKLTAHDTLTYYKINVDDAMLQEQIDSYCRNYGSQETVEDVEASDFVKGILSELDENSAPKEDGILVTEASLIPAYLKDDDERAKFIGLKPNDSVVFNPGRACNGAAAEIASLLKIDRERAAEINSDFRFEVKEISRHRNAELNQKLFDRIFGDNTVKTEEEFREKVKLSLDEQLKIESEYKFQIDMRTFLIEKTGDVAFADGLLKRWLLTNRENTPEKVEEEFPKVIDDLKFNLAKEYIVSSNGLQVENIDIENTAKKVARAQFAQYGMLSMPDHVVESYARDILKRKETYDEIAGRALHDKLTDWLKNRIEIETKEISHEEFAKLLA